MESHYRVARLEALSPAQSVMQALKNINVFALAWNFIANSDAGLMRAFTNSGEIDQVQMTVFFFLPLRLRMVSWIGRYINV